MTVYYQQTSVTAEKSRRACRVQIDNPVIGTPTVMYVEEEILRLPDGSVQSLGLVSNVSESLSDLTKTIPLVNPDTLEETGETITALEVYVALVSHYMQLARERDANAQITEEVK